MSALNIVKKWMAFDSMKRLTTNNKNSLEEREF